MGALAETIKPESVQFKKDIPSGSVLFPDTIDPTTFSEVTLESLNKSKKPFDRFLLGRYAQFRKYESGKTAWEQAFRITKTSFNEPLCFDIAKIEPITPISEQQKTGEPILVFSAQEQPTLENLTPQKPATRERPIPRFISRPALG